MKICFILFSPSVQDNLPSAVGFSHSHILQQWPGTSTRRGDRHEIVSSGAGSCSLGQSVEQAWRPFCNATLKYIKCGPLLLLWGCLFSFGRAAENKVIM